MVTNSTTDTDDTWIRSLNYKALIHNHQDVTCSHLFNELRLIVWPTHVITNCIQETCAYSRNHFHLDIFILDILDIL